MRLLTFNALFKGDVPARLRALGTVLDAGRYDVVCLQELMYRRHLAWLARSFPHRAVSGGPVLTGGLAILSRHPVRRYRFVRYPVTRPLRPELLMRKGIQLAVLDVDGTGYAVVNTHLSANRDDDWSAGNRYTRVHRAELDRLVEVLRDPAPELPVVAVGDFNMPADSAPFTAFVAGTGLRPVLNPDAGTTYRPTPRWPVPPRLDHVLVSASVEASARLVLQDAVELPSGRTGYLSDHYGIEAELRT
jgi:endonuclease/exonuclease/phosphatase family metal-dependent hydrolase